MTVDYLSFVTEYFSVWLFLEHTDTSCRWSLTYSYTQVALFHQYTFHRFGSSQADMLYHRNSRLYHHHSRHCRHKASCSWYTSSVSCRTHSLPGISLKIKRKTITMFFFSATAIFIHSHKDLCNIFVMTRS